jgi:hypothetical protein
MIIGTTNLVINEIGAVFNVRIEGDTDANLFYTDATNSRVGIGIVSPTEKLDVVGNIKLSGNVIPASGQGIDFSANASDPGMTSELLDDYEEGIYTVTLTPQTSGTITLSATINAGAYTKVGRVVTITAQVGIDSVSSPNGTYIDFSIPFAIANLTDNAGRAYFAGVYQQGGAPFTTSINRVLGIETFSTVRFYITAATVAAGDELGIAFSYFTD